MLYTVSHIRSKKLGVTLVELVYFTTVSRQIDGILSIIANRRGITLFLPYKLLYC